MNEKSVQFAVKFERNALQRYKISHGRIRSDSLCCEFLCESKVTTEPGRKSNKDYKEHNAGARGIKMITSSRRAG